MLVEVRPTSRGVSLTRSSTRRNHTNEIRTSVDNSDNLPGCHIHDVHQCTAVVQGARGFGGAAHMCGQAHNTLLTTFFCRIFARLNEHQQYACEQYEVLKYSTARVRGHDPRESRRRMKREPVMRVLRLLYVLFHMDWLCGVKEFVIVGLYQLANCITSWRKHQEIPFADHGADAVNQSDCEKVKERLAFFISHALQCNTARISCEFANIMMTKFPLRDCRGVVFTTIIFSRIAGLSQCDGLMRREVLFRLQTTVLTPAHVNLLF